MGSINKKIKINIAHAHDENAKASIYVNNHLIFTGLLSHKPEWFEFSDYQDHYVRVHIKCLEGEISVGGIDTDFCQDMNPELTLEQRKQLFDDRMNDRPTEIEQPYVYYKNYDNSSSYPLTKRLIPDERLNLRVNGKLIDTSEPTNDPEYDSWVGWVFTLGEDDTLSFDVNILVPADLLQYINDFNLGKKYFNEVLPTEH